LVNFVADNISDPAHRGSGELLKRDANFVLLPASLLAKEWCQALEDISYRTPCHPAVTRKVSEDSGNNNNGNNAA
jgi:hypothetical protein